MDAMGDAIQRVLAGGRELLAVCQEAYEAAGSPYGDDGMARWLREWVEAARVVEHETALAEYRKQVRPCWPPDR